MRRTAFQTCRLQERLETDVRVGRLSGSWQLAGDQGLTSGVSLRDMAIVHLSFVNK